MTKEDRMAMELFKASAAKEENRYVIGLPWKRDPNLLPNNYALAGWRLESLERSLSKNKTKAKMYNGAIEEYIVKGWAHPLPYEELSHPIFKLIIDHARGTFASCSWKTWENPLWKSCKFWITCGRNFAKGIVRDCTTSRKLRQPPHHTLMADLPRRDWNHFRLHSPNWSWSFWPM